MACEVARVLRPGGLFLSCEWDRSVAFHPSLNISAPVRVPRTCKFFDVLTHALYAAGIQPVASSIPFILEGSGHFTDVIPRCFYMPIGPWHSDPRMRRLGRAFRAALVRYADSVRPMLLDDTRWTKEELDEIIGGYIHELKTVRGMVSIYRTVHARKV